jgi:hypothetical protein
METPGQKARRYHAVEERSRTMRFYSPPAPRDPPLGNASTLPLRPRSSFVPGGGGSFSARAQASAARDNAWVPASPPGGGRPKESPLRRRRQHAVLTTVRPLEYPMSDLQGWGGGDGDGDGDGGLRRPTSSSHHLVAING